MQHSIGSRFGRDGLAKTFRDRAEQDEQSYEAGGEMRQKSKSVCVRERFERLPSICGGLNLIGMVASNESLVSPLTDVHAVRLPSISCEFGGESGPNALGSGELLPPLHRWPEKQVDSEAEMVSIETYKRMNLSEDDQNTMMAAHHAAGQRPSGVMQPLPPLKMESVAIRDASPHLKHEPQPVKKPHLKPASKQHRVLPSPVQAALSTALDHLEEQRDRGELSLTDLQGSNAQAVKRMTADERALVHAKRRMRNRLAARESRIRKNAVVAELKRELDTLRSRAAELQTTLQAARPSPSSPRP